MIGSLNHNPNKIGWILKLHSQKKNWLWNLQCRHSQNKIWLWSLQCRHSQKKFWLWSLQCRHSQNLAVESVRTGNRVIIHVENIYCFNEGSCPEIFGWILSVVVRNQGFLKRVSPDRPRNFIFFYREYPGISKHSGSIIYKVMHHNTCIWIKGRSDRPKVRCTLTQFGLNKGQYEFGR